MATVEKRISSDGEVTYRVKVRLKGHPVETNTFKRLTDARIWGSNTESAIREGRHFKTNKLKKHTIAELIQKYIKEVLNVSSADTTNQKHYLNWWKSVIGDYVLADATTSLITDNRNKLIGMKNKYGREVGISTANRYTTALGHVFAMAVNEWEWMENNPVRKIKKLKEPRGRVRFLNDEERNKLLDACKISTNPYLYIVVVLALSTAARKNEILTLSWEDVNLNKG